MFAGLNVELSQVARRFELDRRTMEAAPDARMAQPRLADRVQPNAGYRAGRPGQESATGFRASIKVARSVTDWAAFGFEYYTDLGPVTDISPYARQMRTLFAAIDVDSAPWIFNFGIGRGFGEANRRLDRKDDLRDSVRLTARLHGEQHEAGQAPGSGRDIRGVRHVGRPADLRRRQTGHRPAASDGAAPAEKPATPTCPGDDPKGKEVPEPKPERAVTHHRLRIGATTIDYAATAGTLILRNSEEQGRWRASATSLTRNPTWPIRAGAPLTFAFNGGPGGPRRCGCIWECWARAAS